MALSEAAKEAKRQYLRNWKRKNRDHVNEKQREWRHNNPGKVRESQRRYWERKAQEMKQQNNQA